MVILMLMIFLMIFIVCLTGEFFGKDFGFEIYNWFFQEAIEKILSEINVIHIFDFLSQIDILCVVRQLHCKIVS